MKVNLHLCLLLFWTACHAVYGDDERCDNVKKYFEMMDKNDDNKLTFCEMFAQQIKDNLPTEYKKIVDCTYYDNIDGLHKLDGQITLSEMQDSILGGGGDSYCN